MIDSRSALESPRMVVWTGCACKIVYCVPSQSQCHSDTHCTSDAGNEQHMAEAAWHLGIPHSSVIVSKHLHGLNSENDC